MNPSMREVIINTIKHKQSAYTPWHIDLTTQFIENIKKKIDCQDVELLLGNHLAKVKYKKSIQLGQGLEKDIFGVTWKQQPDGDVGFVVNYPLKDKHLDDYVFPEVKKEFARSLAESVQNDSSGRFRLFSLTMLFFERAWSLVGMEDLLVDMMLEEEKTVALFEKILNHHLELLDVVLDYDIDGIFFADDWGQQNGLIMGPDMWRKYIKPSMRILFDKVKSRGKVVMLHSCGDLREILGDLIDIGLDVYNTVQPEIYDLSYLKNEYGRDLTFYGGISTQQFLPTATPDESAEMAKRMIELMGKNGGYILSPTHAVTADIPVENISAIVQAARDFRW